MSDASRRIYEVLEADMQRIKSKAPAQYKQHVMDTEKRLNILFDHLNNNEVVKADTIVELNRLASSLQAKQYDEAIAIFAALMTNKTDEGSNWMVSKPHATRTPRVTNGGGPGWGEEADSVQQVDCVERPTGWAVDSRQEAVLPCMCVPIVLLGCVYLS